MKNVAIIIPCYNEEETLPHLFENLKILNRQLSNLYQVKFIFVDDGSMDDTRNLLNFFSKHFINSTVVFHEKNLNLGASIKTGIFNSVDCDYIGFLDSDCSYDPMLIINFFKLLDDGVDLVTASPYHPMGKVIGVPSWRLFLSRGLSYIYRFLTLTDYYTFTSMVRAVKVDKVNLLISENNDFIFVAEFFLKAIQKKLKIFEFPAVLGVRKFGQSKMKISKTIISHLNLILNLLRRKL